MDYENVDIYTNLNVIHGRLHFSGNCDITRCEYCVIDSIDRGWFYRHHYICQEKGCSKDELSNDMYNLLMVYSILCGAGWIACGVLSCLGSMRMSKALTLVSGIIFVVLFLIFIVMFGCIWSNVSDFYKLLDEECSQINDQVRKSSHEFMGYSVCAFIFIPIASLLTILSYFAIGTQQYLESKNLEKASAGMNRKKTLGIPIDAIADTKVDIHSTQMGQDQDEPIKN